MAKKKQKIEIEGGGDLRVDLWGALAESEESPVQSKEFEKVVAARRVASSDSSTVKKQQIRGRLVKSGRAAKPVTELYDWPTHLGDRGLKNLAQSMKQAFGCGGTVVQKRIELQGDKFSLAESFLSERGYKLLRSGG